ncbi:MAG: type II toxin-antitoxin system RelE/ParE family toxin [Pseudomonadota bacterium]
MILSFRSKPLRQFAGTGHPPKGDGPTRRLPVRDFERIRVLLALLDQATAPEAMNVTGLRFHALRGAPKRYSVRVTANYRLTFGWDAERGGAIDVDLEDYH